MDKLATVADVREFPAKSHIKLSVMESDGVVFVVDQFGKLIPNQTQVTVSSSTEGITECTMTFNVERREDAD